MNEQDHKKKFKVKISIFHKIIFHVTWLLFITVGINTYIAVRTETNVLATGLIRLGKNIARDIGFGAESAFGSLNWIYVEKMLVQSVMGQQGEIIYVRIVKPNGEIYMADDRSRYGDMVEPGLLVDKEAFFANHICPQTKKRGILIVRPIGIGNETWYVMVKLSAEPIKASIRGLIIRNVLSGILVFSFGVAISFLLAKSISKPIINLTKATEKITSQRYPAYQVTVKSNDEVGILAGAFNDMATKLRESYEHLEKKIQTRTAELITANQQLSREITERKRAEEALRTNEAQLSNAMKIAHLGYWEYDVADDQFTFNDHFYDIFHTTAKQVGDYTMKSARYAELFVHPDDRQLVAIETKNAIETTDPQYNRQLEHRIVYANGEIGYISVRFFVVKDKQGRIIKTFGANQDITDRKMAEIELKNTHEKLLETSRRAGMAEVAADVLHNVGNVLNSINVSTTLVTEKVANSELANLEKLASLINDHIEDLGTFLTEHPQGKHIPVYLTEVSKCLSDEQADIVSRLRVLTENVEHVKDIISTQQSYAKVSGVEVRASLAKLVEDAIQINSAGLQRHGSQLIRELDELPDVEIDKQKVLQILVNLISNAKYAMSNDGKEEKLLTIRLYKHGEDRFRIEVADNGVGIPEENLTRIFSHGFTTKQQGHGFGLHSSALAAKEMGGALTVHSDGVGHGATFTLELPLRPVEVMQ